MNAQVEWRWATSVLVEDLSRTLSASVLTEQETSGPDAALRLLDEHGVLEELASAILSESCSRWKVRGHRLDPGEYVSPSYSAADVRAFLFLSRQQNREYEGSGSLILFDPRAGIQNVFIPGMPWNKSISVRGEQGRFIAAPGWVASMLTPVGEGETLTYLTIEGWVENGVIHKEFVPYIGSARHNTSTR